MSRMRPYRWVTVSWFNNNTHDFRAYRKMPFFLDLERIPYFFFPEIYYCGYKIEQRSPGLHGRVFKWLEKKINLNNFMRPCL